MYSEIDNHGGMVTGIYTGYSVYVDPTAADPKTDAFNAGINAEHSWPQSKGAENLPAKADLHHLFPSEITANGARGSFPFAEIPDQDTDRWYRLLEVTSTPNSAFLDEYSELDLQNPSPLYDGRWESREDHKGDTARAMFYFYTVYRAEVNAADPDFFDVQKNDLREWNLADPVNEAEYIRTCAIAAYQADRPNPFVIDPTLVDRAYFPTVPVRLLFLEAEPVSAGVRLAWETSSEVDHAGFQVLRAGEGEGERVLSDLLAGGPAYTFLDRTGLAGTIYAYSLEAVSRDGSRERFGPRIATYPTPALRVSVRPNPSRPGETVRFALSGPAPDRLEIFDSGGRRIRLWTGADLGEGWDGRLASGAPAPSGVYFVRVVAGSEAATFRFVRIR